MYSLKDWLIDLCKVFKVFLFIVAAYGVAILSFIVLFD